MKIQTALATTVLTLFAATDVGAVTWHFDALIKSGDTPPELGGLEYDGSVAGPAINDRGEAVANTDLRPPAPSSVGFRLLRYDGTSFSVPVESGDAVPGVANATIDLLPTQPRINAAGDVLFSSNLSGSGAGFPADVGLFRLEADGSLSTIVRRGDASGGLQLRTLPFLSNHLNTAGDVVFAANYRASSDLADSAGIFRATEPGFTLSAGRGTPVSNVTNGFISNTRSPFIDDAGRVHFFGGLDSPGASGGAFFREEGGTISLLLGPDDVVTGNGGSATLTGFAEIVDANGSGDFVALTHFGSQEPDLIKFVGGEFTRVIGSGDMVDGFVDPIDFIGSASINERGEVAFFTTNRDNASCNSTVECGIVVERGGALTALVKEGDTIEIAPGDFREISGFGISPRGGFYNSQGQVAFLAFFSGPDNPGLGDTQAWILASPAEASAAVPLPAPAGMLIAGLGWLALRRRQKRRV